MKKIIALFSVFTILVGLTACGKTSYVDGIHRGRGEGRNNDIVVEVVVENKKIQKVEIIEHQEDLKYLLLSEEVIEAIVKKNGTKGVDAVSGATGTSQGILDAVDNALTTDQSKK